MKTQTTIAIAIVASLAVLMASVAPLLLTTNAEAAITQHCRNPSGNEVNGQCNGQPLVKQNENPSGFAPPGQNK
jgi:hypothetical protein